MFKKYFSLLLLITVLLGVCPTLSAQDTAPFKCDKDSMHTLVNVFMGALKPLLDNSDPVDIANTLEDMALEAARFRATCDNLAFKGNKQTVIGPIDIPVGTYKLVAKTEGYLIAQLTVAAGTCGQGQYMSTGLFAVMKDQAKDGAETLFISQGCTALIEVSNVQADWTLEFNNMTTGK